MYTAWISKGLALSSQFSYYRMEGHEQSLPYRQRALHIATCNLVHKTLLTSIISMCRSNYTFIVCEYMSLHNNLLPEAVCCWVLVNHVVYRHV